MYVWENGKKRAAGFFRLVFQNGTQVEG